MCRKWERNHSEGIYIYFYKNLDAERTVQIKHDEIEAKDIIIVISGLYDENNFDREREETCIILVVKIVSFVLYVYTCVCVHNI